MKTSVKTLIRFACLSFLTVLVCVGQLAAAEPLYLVKVWPEKVFYFPDETANLEVDVYNSGVADDSATLVIELVHDLDTAILLANEVISIPAGQTVTYYGTWNTQPLLGLELRARLFRGATEVARKSEYFSCARSANQVYITPGKYNSDGVHWLTLGTALNPAVSSRNFAALCRMDYANSIEKFAWAPSPFCNLTPTQEKWWSGQTLYNTSRSVMLLYLDALHNEGIQALTYDLPYVGGLEGFEFLRHYPDQAAYSGGRGAGNYDPATFDYLETIGPPKQGEQRGLPGLPMEMESAGYSGAGWFAPFLASLAREQLVRYSCTLTQSLAIGIGQLTGSAQMFGFDGVRLDLPYIAQRDQVLDGSFNAPTNFDYSAANAASVQKVKQECWAVNPRYTFAYNNVWSAMNWGIPEDSTPEYYREYCRDDGQIANESFRNTKAPWLDFAELVTRESDIVRYYGGHHAIYTVGMRDDNLYNYIVNYAARSHNMIGYAGDCPWLNKFITRFSSLLWSDGLYGWDATNIISVAQAETNPSNPLLWWKEFAAARPLPDGGSQFILHLINPPAGATTVSPDKMPAADAQGVQVRWRQFAGFRRAMLVELATCESTPITPVFDAGDMVFSIPDIPNWSILVVEADTPTPAPAWARGSALYPSTIPASTSAWSCAYEAEINTGLPVGASIIVDTNASSGAAVLFQPIPSDPKNYVYTQFAYTWPGTPGHYRATYRLKVADNTGAGRVCAVQVSHALEGTPLPGVSRINNPVRHIYANEFTQPNVYQDFTVDFQYPDIGFVVFKAQYFYNNSKTDTPVTWDYVRAERIRDWTPQELANYYANYLAQVTQPSAPVRDGNLDVLLARGLWNRKYRLDEVTQNLPATTKTVYAPYNSNRGIEWRGYDMVNWQPLFSNDVVVLANIEAGGIGWGQAEMFHQYVNRGGGLVVLGGLMTLGQHDNMKRIWSDFLPVNLNGPWEVRKCSPAVPFATPPASGALLSGISWSTPPLVMYRHMVTAKAGATVFLAGSNGEPLLVGMPYGQGRVVVFTGTVLGEAPAGGTAFWDDPKWAEILQRAIQWAAGVPTGVTGTVGTNQVALNWLAVPGATSYIVKRATVKGGPWTVIASGITGTSFTDTGIVDGTGYYYVISAVNASGEMANSTEYQPPVMVRISSTLTGILLNGAYQFNDGSGKPVGLNGLNSYVEVADTEALKYRGGDMTLCAWIKRNASETDSGYIISKPWNGSGQYNYCLYRTSGGRIIFRLDGSTAVELATDTTVSAGVWHHIAATVNSAGEMRIYIDGVEKKSGFHNITDWTPSGGDVNLPLAIGTLYPYAQGWSGNTGFSFDGMIDETTIYNRALSAPEIQQLFNY
ncbi:MAG: LamG-like jellyroll fold domain-containing protein [Kiritimatiellia bacterium]|nr:LamG-like jellyroll fold domain-containing protein [Kiritimatiellia bacterium]